MARTLAGMNERLLSQIATVFGAGCVAFGVVPTVAPRAFARLFGLSEPAQLDAAAVYRSVGARDLAVGVGLLWAAAKGQPLAPWFLARVICDGVDTLACGAAVAQGYRNPRFLGLTGFAAGAAGAGAYLFSAALRGDG